MKNFLAITLLLFFSAQKSFSACAPENVVLDEAKVATVSYKRPQLNTLIELSNLLPKTISRYNPHLTENPEAFFASIKETIPLCNSIYNDFEKTRTEFIALYKTKFDDQSHWMNGIGIPAQNNLFGADENKKIIFTPFVQKLIVSGKSRVILLGDLHGAYHSFIGILKMLYKRTIIDNNLKILKENFYMSLLGDFVDRGIYGVEIIYTIMRLKLANPDKVFLVRGNHEDIDQNVDFMRELTPKLGIHKTEDQIKLMSSFYNVLPLALYVGKGKDFGQLCHGGIDLAYDPKKFLGVLPADINDESKDAHHNNVSNVEFELLTKTNYNIINTTSQLDKEVCHKIAKAVAALNSEFKTPVDEVVNNCFKCVKKYVGRLTLLEWAIALNHGLEFNMAEVERNYLYNIENAKKSILKEQYDVETINEFFIEYETLTQIIEEKFNTCKQQARNSFLCCFCCYPPVISLKRITEIENGADRTYHTTHYALDKEKIEKLSSAQQALIDIIHARLSVHDVENSLALCVKEMGIRFLHSIDNPPQKALDTPFLWGDFALDTFLDLITHPHRPCYGPELTAWVLRLHGLRFVIRAHQHSGEMFNQLKKNHGITKLFGRNCDTMNHTISIENGTAFTLQRAQSSIMAEADRVHQKSYHDLYDTFGILIINGDYENWTLTKHHVPDSHLQKRDPLLYSRLNIAKQVTKIVPMAHATQQNDVEV